MYELSRVTPDKVYVCEGLFDCLRLWCNGKYAVAGFGCLFNNYQARQVNLGLIILPANPLHVRLLRLLVDHRQRFQLARNGVDLLIR